MIAEGLRSRTRELLFPGAQVDELGYFVAYATIPRTADDDKQWRMHLAGRGRVVHLRPDDVGSTRAMLSLKSDVRGLQGYRARPPSRLGGPVCWKVRISSHVRVRIEVCQCARAWASSSESPCWRPSMIDQNREHFMGSLAGHCRPCSSAVRATSIRCCCSDNSANL